MKNGCIEAGEIRAAREALGGAVQRTPLWPSRTLSDLTGRRVLLKTELFQKTGSFKPRGILYRLLRTTPEQRSRGFVSISAGNAAAALAWSARRLEAGATVVMPATAVRSKIEATRGYGGEVVLTGGDLMGACEALRDERGLTFVHPFDDLDVMAGHGVVGLEILEDAPEVEAVVVPIGGGGLIGGIAAAIKTARPEIEVIGVEPRGADGMSRSLASGRAESLTPRTVADGLAAPFAGEHTLRHVQSFVDRVVLVEDDRILEAMRLLVTRCKLAVEPSAAAALAAVMDAGSELRARRVALLVSGGNVDPDRLATLVS